VALESAQIVDSGSTADGDYWRFEDGLQMCIIKKSDTVDVNTGSLYFPMISDDYYYSLPVNFIDLNFNIQSSVDSYYVDIYKTTINNTSSVGVRFWNDTVGETGLSVDLFLLAIGRWK
jgi:hypothetical protein